MGVSGRWGGARLKDETQFLACADAPVKQLWVLCVQAGSGASGHKEMEGKKEDYSGAIGSSAARA